MLHGTADLTCSYQAGPGDASEGRLSLPSLAMEGNRSPNRHHNPSAARALALIREAVAEADTRARSSPSPTPSPTPSPRPLPGTQPSYPPPYHTFQGPEFRSQEGHIREEGWSRTQHGPSFSPRAGPGPASGGQHTYPPPHQAYAGPGYTFGGGEAQLGPRHGASLSSRSLSADSELMMAGHHQYPQQSWGHSGGELGPRGRPHEAQAQSHAALHGPSPGTAFVPAPWGQFLQHQAPATGRGAEAGGPPHHTVGLNYQQDGGGAGLGMASHVPRTFHRSASQDPFPPTQHPYGGEGPAYWSHGSGNPALSGPQRQTLLVSRPAPDAPQSTRPWELQVTHQPFAVGGGAAASSQAPWLGVPQQGTPHMGQISFAQDPGGQYPPRAILPGNTLPGIHPCTPPQPPRYTQSNLPGVGRPTALPDPSVYPYHHAAGSQHTHGIPHPAAAEAVPVLVGRPVTGPAPPGTWHSTPSAGWHYAPGEPARGQVGGSSQLPSVQASAPLLHWPTGSTPAQACLPGSTMAEATQDRQVLVPPGAGAAVVAEARGREEELARGAQPLPREQPPALSTNRASLLRADQHPVPSSLAAGSPPQGMKQESEPRSSREEFSLCQLSGLDWMSPEVQAWGPEGDALGLGELGGGLEGGPGQKGGQESEALLREIDADFGDEMEGDWMDGVALHGSHIPPAPAAQAAQGQGPSAQAPAVQAPPGQAAVARAPAEQVATTAGDLASVAQALAPPAHQAGLKGTKGAPRASEQPPGRLSVPGAPRSGKPQRSVTTSGAVEQDSAGGMQQRRLGVAVGVPGKRQLDSLGDGAATDEPVAMDVAGAGTAAVQRQGEIGSVKRQGESGGVPKEVASRGSARANVRTQNRNRVLLPPDGQYWTKYGEKMILSDSITRSYFKCSLTKSHGCSAKKVVDFSMSSPLSVAPRIQYSGSHSHPPPPQDSRIRSTATESPWGGSQVYHVTSVPSTAASSPREGVPGVQQVAHSSMRVPGGARLLGRPAGGPRGLQASRSAQGTGHRGDIQIGAPWTGDAVGSAVNSPKDVQEGQVVLTHTRSLSE